MLHNNGKQLENHDLRLTPEVQQPESEYGVLRGHTSSDSVQEVLSLNASAHSAVQIMNTEPNMLCLDGWRHLGVGYVS